MNRPGDSELPRKATVETLIAVDGETVRPAPLSGTGWQMTGPEV